MTMKEKYLKPAMKTRQMPEPLMNAPIGSEPLDPSKFEPGAKGVTLGDEDEDVTLYENKSVWED